MRNKLYITIFTIMSTILGGCEGGLEPEIYDNLTGDNFPKTEADASCTPYIISSDMENGTDTIPTTSQGLYRACSVPTSSPVIGTVTTTHRSISTGSRTSFLSPTCITCSYLP